MANKYHEAIFTKSASCHKYTKRQSLDKRIITGHMLLAILFVAMGNPQEGPTVGEAQPQVGAAMAGTLQITITKQRVEDGNQPHRKKQ